MLIKRVLRSPHEPLSGETTSSSTATWIDKTRPAMAYDLIANKTAVPRTTEMHEARPRSKFLGILVQKLLRSEQGWHVGSPLYHVLAACLPIARLRSPSFIQVKDRRRNF